MSDCGKIKLSTNDGQAVHIADYYLRAHRSVPETIDSL